MIRRVQLSVLGFVLIFGAATAGAEDLRQKFGTTSSQCATALNQAIESVQARKPQQAVGHADQATKHDPTCVLAWYWLATANMDLGNVEKAIALYKKSVAVSLEKWGGKADNVATDACINLGLTLIQLDELDQAKYWFSQAILLDPKDEHKLHWKAYRNMAIATFNGGDPLSATVQALRAKEAAPGRVEDKMITDFQAGIGNEVGFTVLTPFEKPPTIPNKRNHESKLTRLPELEEALNAQTSVTGMTYGFETNLLLIYSNESETATLVSASQLKTKQITLPSPVRKARMFGKTIYALSASGTTLYEVRQGSAEPIAHKLPGLTSDMDYCPRTNLAFLAIGGEIYGYDLATDLSRKTEIPGQMVACDPYNQLLYCAFKDMQRRGPNHLIIGGRPVFINQHADPDADLDFLFQAVYNHNGETVITAMREKAAWNGSAMDVAHNGSLVTVTGGGGYRGPGGGGYGTGVFPTNALGSLAGFYPCGAYSKRALFSPSTPQIAVLGTNKLNIFDLGSSTPALSESAKFKTPATWSPDGTLFLAYVEGEGIRAYANSVSAQEKEDYGNARLKTFEKKPAVPGAVAAARPPTEPKRAPSASLARFAPTTAISSAKNYAAKAAAIDHTRSEGSPRWQECGLYSQPAPAAAEVEKLRRRIGSAPPGVTLFQARKLLSKYPAYVPAQLLQGEALVLTGQRHLAIDPLLQALRKDAGRSDLSSEALRLLGQLYHEDGKEPQALHCFATGLELDAGYQATRQAAAALFRKHGILLAGQRATPAQQLPRVSMGIGNSGVIEPGKHLKSNRTLTSEQVYNAAATRTVTVETNDGHGSGVCISEHGHILTCSHVVGPGNGPVRITTYSLKNGSAVKNETTTATVIYRDRARDVAILKPTKLLPSLKYLSLAKTTVKPGQRVFAIGTPGLGQQRLTQSLSEGVVSAAEREVEGQKVIQHTAAVNPGNSGGPLISEQGEVIGMVVIKAHLENVAFAVPASELRETIGW